VNPLALIGTSQAPQANLLEEAFFQADVPLTPRLEEAFAMRSIRAFAAHQVSNGKQCKASNPVNRAGLGRPID
jgi:hypothetical protein